MDNQSPEMEKLSYAMRDLMFAWVANPDNEDLKARYKAVQAQYQEMRTAWIKSQEAAATS
jgi:hypothetical protein